MIRFVVAMPAEARPLIDHFALRALPHPGPFPQYQNENAALIVSGIGKVTSAAATAFLHASMSDARLAAWLNVGVAGHARRPLGEAVVAHRITDAASGKSWYPPQLLQLPCDSDIVVTVERPVSDYADDMVYDMEAAGFFTTACRFSASEIVQCYKIVSDNLAAPVGQVTTELITSLIADKLEEIEALVAGLERLSHEYQDSRFRSP